MFWVVLIKIMFVEVADKEGFEPSVPVRIHALSRGADSASSPTCPCCFVGEIIMHLA